MSAADPMEAASKAVALLKEVKRLLKSNSGLLCLVTHSACRDGLIEAAGLKVLGVHKCYLSDEGIMINSLRTVGSENSPLVTKLHDENTTIEVFTEVRQRIARKNTALILRKFMKNTAYTDERLRGSLRQAKNYKKQDFCWIYILTHQ